MNADQRLADIVTALEAVALTPLALVEAARRQFRVCFQDADRQDKESIRSEQSLATQFRVGPKPTRDEMNQR